jgi:hypothetical protein
MEDWRETGFPLDSLALALSNDPRVIFSQENRYLEPDSMAIDAVSLPEAPPVSYNLSQNYPNPFNPTTTIAYRLPHRADVVVSIYNILGEWIEDLTNGVEEAGEHSIVFDATSMPSGVYICRLANSDFSAAKRMVFIK